MSDYLDPFRDSLVVQDVAQGILSGLSVANSDRAPVLLRDLSASEQSRYRSLACLVLRSTRGDAINLATWHAARVLARTLYPGREFEDLTVSQQGQCRVGATATCAAYVQQLKGLVYPTEVAKAEALVSRTLAKLTDDDAPVTDAPAPDLPPPDALFAVGMQVATAAVRPFLKREPR